MERKEQPPFEMEGAAVTSLTNAILHSLAARYEEVLSQIAKATGRKFKRIFIVGGGSRNAVLNRLTTQRTGLEVILGATESSTVGNFAVQLATHERDWTASRGVTSDSVAKWAKALTSSSPVEPAARGN
jgi:rhamnulokinase